jgi:hypothetical protein
MGLHNSVREPIGISYPINTVLTSKFTELSGQVYFPAYSIAILSSAGHIRSEDLMQN